MADEISADFAASELPTAPLPQRAPARRQPRVPSRAPVGSRRLGKDTHRPSSGPGNDSMRVSIQSHIAGAELERVCVIAGAVAYAPSGRGGLLPGQTSPTIAVAAGGAGKRGAVYFELSAGPRTLRFVTDELFDITPGTVVVVAIGDDTVAHVAPLEVEGAVARMARGELPGARLPRR